MLSIIPHTTTAYSLNGLSSHTATTRTVHQPQLRMAAGEGSNKNLAPIAAAMAAASIASAAHAADPWAYSTLIDSINSDTVANVIFAPEGQGAVAVDDQGKDHAVQLFPGADTDLVHSLRDHKIPFAVAPTPTAGALEKVAGFVFGLGLQLAPTIIFIAGLNFLFIR